VIRVVVVGAGGHGRETLDLIRAINEVEPRVDLIGVVADHADVDLLGRLQVPHLGHLDELVGGQLAELPEPVALVVAIGDPQTRRDVVDRIAALPHTFAPALVHPQASIGADVLLGAGVVVAAGARITTNVRVGVHVQVNVNAVISHDCVVGDYATLSPGVLVNGSVTIGAGAFIGTGAIVTPGHSVGADAVVGAGAVVVGDVPAGVTTVGVPARWST
jgi:sugar O-acyltransferase (sialic acid O-acetyltransferase NeuD family)